MARRHWLDPLARQLLIASGQLAPAAPTSGRRPPADAPPPASAEMAHAAAVERDLVALKLRQQPARALASAAEVEHAAALGWRLDVNRATAADWQRLPGLTTEQLDLLLRLQRGGVQLSGPDDLQRLLGLSEDQLHSWLPVLAFRWYGDGPPPAPRQPLDLNRAGGEALLQFGLSGEQAQRLQRERARRPFRDLADLQERLHLPAAQVEAWIGRVCFGSGPTGPRLPPAPRLPPTPGRR